MTLRDRNEALAAFRKAQREANERDKRRYEASLPPTPEPSEPTLTARERALLRAEQQGA